MTREIKFRAYINNEMIYSDNGKDYSLRNQIKISRSREHPKEVHFQFGSRFASEHMETIAFSVEGGEFNIMQYTGLLDRNGKEIYEGDILVRPYIDPMGGLYEGTEDGRYKVGFEHGQFVIYMMEPRPLYEWCKKQKGEYVPNYGNLTIVSNTTVLKIIGNIHEHPELLKEEA